MNIDIQCSGKYNNMSWKSYTFISCGISNRVHYDYSGSEIKEYFGRDEEDGCIQRIDNR